MRRAGWGPKKITKKSAAACLTRLLWDCRPEMLATFTAESLAKSYRVDVAQAQRLLDGARESRL